MQQDYTQQKTSQCEMDVDRFDTYTLFNAFLFQDSILKLHHAKRQHCNKEDQDVKLRQ